MGGIFLSVAKDIQGEIMKRRVSFLLMLILAITLTIALSSCGECEHVATDTRKDITVQANCKTVEQYEEVV